MKNSLILGLGLLLTSCGSDATTGTEANIATTVTAPVASANPDPRDAIIRQQHQQLLSKQKEYIAQLGTLKGYEKLSPARIKKSTGDFAFLIAQSQANLMALDQLDANKAHEPAQVALLGELAGKEASLLARGEKQLVGIHNEHYLPK